MEINYFEKPGLSSSLIKALIHKGEPNYYENRAYVVGGIVDLIKTENKKLEDVCQVDRSFVQPRPQMKLYCENLFRILRLDKDNKGLNISHHEEAYTLTDIKSKKLLSENGKLGIKEEFESDCQSYWNYLIRRELIRKQKIELIDEEEERQVYKCLNDLERSKYDKYFNYMKLEEQEEIFTQLELYTELFKIKLDSVLVDHKNKTIQLIDLKTIGTFTENAVGNMISFRYDIQANYYHKVFDLILTGEDFETNDKRFLEIIDLLRTYTLSNTFNFVFVSKNRESQVLEIKYQIEDIKNIRDRVLHTNADIQAAIDIYTECVENGVRPDLTNYYLMKESSITI